MGLVGVAKIGQVLPVGNIGLGDQHRILASVLDQGAQQAHYLVGLLQIEAGGARDFPQKGHRIEAENAHAVIEVMPDDRDELLQHLRVAEVQVDLVVAEGAPDVSHTLTGLHLLQQGRGPRTHHVRQVILGRGSEKIIPARIATLEEILEPQAAAGAVIDHQVRHQVIVPADRVDILPVTE